MSEHRPKGGRRHEDFPEVVARDEAILRALAEGPMPRNYLAIWICMAEHPRKVRYALERLMARGLVEHVRQGYEGHGYYRLTTEEGSDDARG